MSLRATVEIKTALRNGRTVLAHSFCDAPYKLANITEGGTALRLMLMSCAPGVLDGDVYQFHIHVDRGTALSLETQSYQRLFQMQGSAHQTCEVVVDADASFNYLPHPTVPHKSSSFSVHNRIYLHESSTLLWGEVISCGRKGNNEVFAFKKYHSITEIFLSGKLVAKENLLLQPAEKCLRQMGQLEGFTHQSGLFIINAAADHQLADAIFDLLSAYTNIAFGVTALSVPGLMVRVLGHGAEQLFGINKQISDWLDSKQIFKPHQLLTGV